MRTKLDSDRYVDPDSWVKEAPINEGSWWPAWVNWLATLSGGLSTTPNKGAPEYGLTELASAPGTYVQQR
jgi:polyhydroxyalkanoate synthase